MKNCKQALLILFQISFWHKVKYFLNIHGGIVPNYRNVHGQFWSYYNKDYSNMGSSILHLTKGIDNGNVALMSNLDISLV